MQLEGSSSCDRFRGRCTRDACTRLWPVHRGGARQRGVKLEPSSASSSSSSLLTHCFVVVLKLIPTNERALSYYTRKKSPSYVRVWIEIFRLRAGRIASRVIIRWSRGSTWSGSAERKRNYYVSNIMWREHFSTRIIYLETYFYSYLYTMIGSDSNKLTQLCPYFG